MAIAFDASSESGSSAFTGTTSWTHSPSGTPKGVIVWVVSSGTSGADEVSGVTYGGVSMTEVPSSPHASTQSESSTTHCFFLGSGLGTGNKTIEVTCSGSTYAKIAFAVTVTADNDTEFVDDAASDVSSAYKTHRQTLSLGGATCFAALAGFSGDGNVSGVTAQSGWTKRQDHDFGASTAHLITYDTVGSTDVSAGWDTAIFEETEWIAVAIKESTGGGAVSVSSTATVTLTGSAAGAVQVAGSSAAAVSLTGAATGAVAVTGASAATISTVGSAAGTVGVAGASAATVALTGTAQGAVGSSPISATSSATVSLEGTAAGAVAVTGASAATVSLTGAAQGAVGNVPITGESDATVSLTGSSAGAVQVSAASAGSTAVAGAATAAVAITGASIGSFDLIGAATGTVGYEGVYVESAATVSLAGTSAGKVAVAGESAAQVTLGGTAEGQIRIVGESAATISVVGVSVGAVTEPDVNLAQSEGTFTLAGSAAGVVWSRDDITASGRAFVGRKKATTGAIGRGGSATGRAGMEAG